jgi:hypothetical protein
MALCFKPFVFFHFSRAILPQCSIEGLHKNADQLYTEAAIIFFHTLIYMPESPLRVSQTFDEDSYGHVGKF